MTVSLKPAALALAAAGLLSSGQPAKAHGPGVRVGVGISISVPLPRIYLPSRIVITAPAPVVVPRVYYSYPQPYYYGPTYYGPAVIVPQAQQSSLTCNFNVTSDGRTVPNTYTNFTSINEAVGLATATAVKFPESTVNVSCGYGQTTSVFSAVCKAANHPEGAAALRNDMNAQQNGRHDGFYQFDVMPLLCQQNESIDIPAAGKQVSKSALAGMEY